MDWYLSGHDAVGLQALRHQVRDYLVRHAEPHAPVGDAELVVQELVANAVEHATGPIWVRLTWVTQEPVLDVWDLGPGFRLSDVGGTATVLVGAAEAHPGATPAPVEAALPSLSAEGGRGLFIVSNLAFEFEVVTRRGGGAHVSARLPVRRLTTRSIDHPPPTTSSLPGLDEALPGGGFGRESFLRALVVQLSQAIEHTAGPGADEDVVAQVGTAVGGQMEAAFRAARDVVGRLDPQQLAECYVNLKHAIDGGFYVIELTDDRIVLGNTRCPFGDAVKKAPALCRMTSSVFGGIASRNSAEGSAAVVLEERIAIGDPGCRVVVHLGPAPAESAPFAHSYRRSVQDEGR